MSKLTSSKSIPVENKDEDSDEGYGNFVKDASNGLSYEKLVYMRNIRHPRHVVYENQTTNFVHHPLCTTKTGWSHCKRENRKTDFKEYGVGIVLYYQFLKYLQIMMFLFTIMNIPNYLLFFHGTVSTRSNQEGNLNNTATINANDNTFADPSKIPQ
jgi:hypothetical protein